jgi:hypothetical protein
VGKRSSACCKDWNGEVTARDVRSKEHKKIVYITNIFWSLNSVPWAFDARGPE